MDGENSFPKLIYIDSDSIFKSKEQVADSFSSNLSLLPESPLELLLGGAGGSDVNGQQKLLEVDVAVLVGVERAEHVVAELLRVAAGEEELVHVYKLGRSQAAVGAVLLEALVPLLDRVLVVAGVGLEELQVLLTEARLALDAAHDSGCSQELSRRQNNNLPIRTICYRIIQRRCNEQLKRVVKLMEFIWG